MKPKQKLNAHRPQTKLNLSLCAALISTVFNKGGLGKKWDSQRARILGVSLLIHLTLLVPVSFITTSTISEKIILKEYQEALVEEPSIDEVVETPDPQTQEQQVDPGGSSSVFNADELVQAAQIPDLVGTSFSSDFQLPLARVPSTGSGLGKAGLGVGNGVGSGVGAGRGGGTRTLGGMSITKGVLIVVLDVSGSMTEYNLSLRKQIKERFPEAIVIESNSATGTGFGSTERLDMRAADDLYDAAYLGMSGRLFVAAIYMLSDFADGSDDKATEQFLNVLQENEIKLYLCYINKKPYAKLLEYANRSGQSEKFRPDP